MNTICEFLQSYSGRDQVVRTVNYGCVYLSAITSGKVSERLEIIGTQMSACRTILRLYDDIPMLKYTLSYGLGKAESDKALRYIGLLTNIVDQMYYPLEHIAWAADHKLISVNSSPWWTSAIAAWAISLYLGIIRATRYILLLQKQKKNLVKEFGIASEGQQQLTLCQLTELFTVVQNTFDLCNAVHWLPKGFLWSEQLKPWQVGFFGLVSSIAGMCKTLLAQEALQS